MIASIIATRKLVIGKIVISLSVTAGPVAFILVLDWPIFHHGIVSQDRRADATRDEAKDLFAKGADRAGTHVSLGI